MNFKKRYRDLETEVLSALRLLIANSCETSAHMETPILEVDVNGYNELAIVNDRHTFIDINGLHGDALYVCNLEELIEILEDASN